MIRVLLRHHDEADAALLGDFPPDQIDAVERFVMAVDIHDGDGDPERPASVIRQWVMAAPPSPSRWCVELVWAGPDD